jgi:hypothetical protein
MKRLVMILPLVVMTRLAMAQTDAPIGLDAERNLAELGNGNNATTVRFFDNRYEGMKGSPYFNEEWAKADITANKTIFRNVEVKYNAYESHIRYRNPEGAEFILEAFKIDQVVMKDSKTNLVYVLKSFPALASLDPQLAKGFAVPLYEGSNVQFVMVPVKNLIKANFKGPYSSGNKYDELQDDKLYYLMVPNQTVSKVKLTKKSLLKALPDKQDQVDKYITSERLNASLESGWVKALAYYETL